MVIPLFSHLQIAKLRMFLFSSKQRTSVIQHLMLLAEFKRSSVTCSVGQTVIYVEKHKLGDRRPATLVLDDTMMTCMER